MLSNKFTVTGLLFFGGIVHAMENNDLQLIQKKEELVVFKGKFVAYKTNYGSSGTYKLSSDSGLSYGYVRVCPGNSWAHFDKLIKKGSVHSSIPLNNKVISRESLAIREISPQEAQEIVAALNAKKAEFDYTWGDKEREIISKLELIV